MKPFGSIVINQNTSHIYIEPNQKLNLQSRVGDLII